MTSGSTRTVDHASLTLGAVLGRGGQGTVYPVANRRINEAVNGGWEVVYKEYNPATLALLDADALRAMVDLLGNLDAVEARWLCDKTSWPVAVVERSGQVCGFLMRAVPDRFRFDMRALSGTTPPKSVLATLEFLLNDEAYIANIGLAVSPRDRLELLADLATTLDRLHSMGIAVGDLSPKNLLFATGQDAGFFIIDCDAMRLRGVSALPQVETPDWQAPAGEERATSATDVYKFGLLATRMAAGDQTTTDTMRLATIGAGLGHLARASLNADPTSRPTSPAHWINELNAAAQAAPQAVPPPPPPTPSRRGGGRAGHRPERRPQFPRRRVQWRERFDRWLHHVDVGRHRIQRRRHLGRDFRRYVRWYVRWHVRWVFDDRRHVFGRRQFDRWDHVGRLELGRDDVRRLELRGHLRRKHLRRHHLGRQRRLHAAAAASPAGPHEDPLRRRLRRRQQSDHRDARELDLGFLRPGIIQGRRRLRRHHGHEPVQQRRPGLAERVVEHRQPRGLPQLPGQRHRLLGQPGAVRLRPEQLRRLLGRRGLPDRQLQGRGPLSADL